MRVHTVADLRVPRVPLEPHDVADLLRELFATIDRALADPAFDQAERMRLLSNATIPLAQVLLSGGTHRSVVVQHAAELLESQFLPRVLADSPRLAALFLDS